MDIKKLKLDKKLYLTKHIKESVEVEVETVDYVKDNTLLLKTKIQGKEVYYKIVVSEVMKNIDDWTDLAREYNEKKKG